jgi:hypothetical protein
VERLGVFVGAVVVMVQRPEPLISMPSTLPASSVVPASHSPMFLQPSMGSQVSVVQLFLSSQLRDSPLLHVPVWHVSWPLQMSPSAHAVPSGALGSEHVPVAGSQVPAMWQLSEGVHSTGFSPVHVPAWQASVWVQASESSQTVPSAAAGSEHVPVAGSHVPATWH